MIGVPGARTYLCLQQNITFCYIDVLERPVRVPSLFLLSNTRLVLSAQRSVKFYNINKSNFIHIKLLYSFRLKFSHVFLVVSTGVEEEELSLGENSQPVL